MIIQEHVALQSFNTFGINSTAEYLIRVKEKDDIHHAREFAQSKNLQNWILGGGSNLLFVQENQPGLCIKSELLGKKILSETSSHLLLEAAGGENWHELVEFCVQKNWGGIENLSLIPGLVGASPMQNIGAYGVELKDVFHSLDAFHFPTGEIHTFSKADCGFGYRESVFKRKYTGQYLIMAVRFQLEKFPKTNTRYGAIEQTLLEMNIENPTIQDVSKAVIKIRSEKLPNPSIVGNAGSFFKNPVISIEHFEKLKKEFTQIPSFSTNSPDQVKIPAAWLIEYTGWKGFRKGNVGCHPKQALVLVNYGNAIGRDILELSHEIKVSVKSTFNIELETEVNIR